MLNLSTPIYVVRTRVGAAMGRAEQNIIATRLIERQNDGLLTQLSPDFVESVEYMRALSPPELGPARTLRAKYGKKVDALRAFGESLRANGVVTP
jgi:hypothetical protein